MKLGPSASPAPTPLTSEVRASAGKRVYGTFGSVSALSRRKFPVPSVQQMSFLNVKVAPAGFDRIVL